MTAHNQFLRKASLQVGNDTGGVDLSQLQFYFSIKQADLEFPQTATIRIYNMSSDTAKLIKANEYTRVILQAGYQQGAYGVVFDGEIVQARLGRESAVDTYMEILAAEGYSAHQGVINQTLAAGSTEKDAANAAATTMGRSVRYNNYDATAKLPRGQVLYGMSRDVLHQAAATAGCSYFYENGQITWVPLQGYKNDDVVVMNANTGMVGWPEQTQAGVKVRCLINPLLEVGARLKIDNASIIRAGISTSVSFVNNLPSLDDDGIYRIYVIEHRGDTRGNDWYSDIICLSVDPSKAGLTSLVQKGQF